MLKKVSILGLAILLLISVMSGCISTGYLNEDSSTIEEQTTTTPVTTTTPINKEAISAQLAQLTNEDGTGVINLEMTNDEIEQKLNQYNIPYEKNEYGTIVNGDGSIYDTGLFEVMQTKSGLKKGDSLSRVVELYGQPNEKIDGEKCYVYHTGQASYGNSIVLLIEVTGDKVNMIIIKIREEIYGGAE